MAPLRPSRSNRHLHAENAPRNRAGGIFDHDPTEGLPVKKWELVNVTVKQDLADEEEDDSKNGSGNTDHPWPELPLPRDFHLLPLHSQELLRRARMGTRHKPSIYNRTTGEYDRPPADNSGIIMSTLKSKHLTTNDVGMQADDENIDPESSAQNHLPITDEDRTFTVRKWMPVPAALADKRPEPKYLADRRPGLPGLYGQQVASVSGSTGHGNGRQAVSTSSGVLLDTSSSVLSAGGAATSTGPLHLLDNPNQIASGLIEVPKRRPPPPPPKRKKKLRIGSRRRKVQVLAPTEQVALDADGNEEKKHAATLLTGGDENAEDSVMKEEGEEDEEGSSSGTEDGTEVGEIDDDKSAAGSAEAHAENNAITAGGTTTTTTAAPEDSDVDADADAVKNTIESAATEEVPIDDPPTEDPPPPPPAILVPETTTTQTQSINSEPAEKEQTQPQQAPSSTSPPHEQKYDHDHDHDLPVPIPIPIPAPVFDQTQTQTQTLFEDGSVDLLGTLENAVQGMEGEGRGPA